MNAPSARHSAVITGIGLLTPVGRGAGKVFDALCRGESGIHAVPAEDPLRQGVEVVGSAPQVTPAEVLKPGEGRAVDRFILLALAAAEDAMADAGLEVGGNADPERVGVVVGSGAGGLATFEDQSRGRIERGRAAVSPYLLPGFLPNMAAARIAIKYDIRGYSSAIATACTAGAHSIADALRLIRHGEADVVICGGAEVPLVETTAFSFSNAGALATGWSDDPTAASRPFDRRRNGFVLAEGAGILIVESRQHADARGAAAYADLIGWGATTDAYRPTTPRPDGSGAAGAMRRALADAGADLADVGYINAHGTSTKLGDLAEAKAIRDLFDAHAPAVSSTKSMTGHMLGASGAVEAAVAALAVARGTMPPTANLDEVDPACDADHVRHTARAWQPAADSAQGAPAKPIALSNSFAFGGHNVALAFGPASTRQDRTGGEGAADVL